MSVLGAAMQTVGRVGAGGLQPIAIIGRVEAVRGLSLLIRDLPAPVGSLIHLPEIGPRQSSSAIGEIVGFQGQQTIAMMLGQTTGIRSGDRVVALHSTKSVPVGSCMLGRVLNGLGEPIDGGPPLHDLLPQPLDPAPLLAMNRSRIVTPMPTGVRAIDLMTTLGRGQRIGLFAGPGVGKSTLLGSITRGCASDVNVVALIGERGREVKDFIEHSLGKAGLARSVVVVATGDESPLMRTRAAMSACSIAEFFRDRGMSVMLMMDSVTRFAHAQRQIGLSAGEPPASKGYTPSVFASMARLLERAGSVVPALGGGSITGLYTVLVEGDDMTEPVADAARGILDGHIILSRSLAQKGHYPAIDVLDSVSRVADDVTDAVHQAARRQLVRLLALYREVEDLVQIGAYAKGSSAETDLAIHYQQRINDLLKQDRTSEKFEEAKAKMVKLALESGNAQPHQGARRSA